MISSLSPWGGELVAYSMQEARLRSENASLRHQLNVARLSHEQLNLFIKCFDEVGFKGHDINVQVRMAVNGIKNLREKLSGEAGR